MDIHTNHCMTCSIETLFRAPTNPFASTPGLPSLCPLNLIQQWKNLKASHPGFKLAHPPRMHPALVEVVTGPYLMKEVTKRLDQKDPSSTFMASFGITCREAAQMGVGAYFFLSWQQ